VFSDVMTAPEALSLNLPDLKIQKLHPKDADTILPQLRATEKKSFPANEAFDFSVGLLGKQNTCILSAFSESESGDYPIAYAVYVQWRGVVLLQKLCVSARFRGRKIGNSMMFEVISRARRTKCSAIELWVDESRTIAQKLYSCCGFEAIQNVQHYYGAGRHGIKMRLDLPQ
jgi:ribosomal protein S18 acetylase RimI-like enzyme